MLHAVLSWMLACLDFRACNALYKLKETKSTTGFKHNYVRIQWCGICKDVRFKHNYIIICYYLTWYNWKYVLFNKYFPKFEYSKDLHRKKYHSIDIVQLHQLYNIRFWCSTKACILFWAISASLITWAYTVFSTSGAISASPITYFLFQQGLPPINIIVFECCLIHWYWRWQLTANIIFQLNLNVF